MAFAVSVRRDVSISAPVYKGEGRQFSSVLKGTLVCAPDGWGLVATKLTSESLIQPLLSRGLVPDALSCPFGFLMNSFGSQPFDPIHGF